MPSTFVNLRSLNPALLLCTQKGLDARGASSPGGQGIVVRSASEYVLTLLIAPLEGPPGRPDLVPGAPLAAFEAPRSAL